MRVVVIGALCAAAALGCSRTGSFEMPATPQSQDVTFTGSPDCQPKIVLFFYNNLTADGGGADAAFGFGAGASSSARFAGFARSTNNLGTSNTDRALSNTRSIVIINASQTIIAAADYMTALPNGFRLDWIAADGTVRIINYMAWGGADVTNVHVDSYTGSGSPQSITAPGFQPDLVIFYFPASATGTGFTQVIGMATAADNWSVATGASDNVPEAIAKRYQRTSMSFGHINTVGSITTECTTAMTPTGFDQTCSPQGSLLTQYIAIKGGSYKLCAFNAPTSDGQADITGIGFTPKAVLLGSFGTTSAATVQAHARATWGAGTSSTSRWTVWHGDTDVPTTTVTSSYLDRAKIFQTRTEAGATPTALSHADLVGFGSGTVTLDWDADAVARQVVCLAISTAEAAASAAHPRRIFTW